MKEGQEKMPEEQNIHILICLSASPNNQNVIRSAARFAHGNKGKITALYVDNGKQRLQDSVLRKNMDLAAGFGAQLITVDQKDIIQSIIDYADRLAITDLFIGYSGPSDEVYTYSLPVYRLMQNLPDVEVHIIPGSSVHMLPSQLGAEEGTRFHLRDFLIMTGIMAAATGLSVIIDRSKFSNGNIITIYILAVLITSVMTAESIYGIIAAGLYILLFNYLFIDPRFTLLVYDPYYMVTYLVSVIAAVITGNISSRMQKTARQARINAYQSQLLLNTSELLQKAGSFQEIINITTAQLRELLVREIVFYSEEEISRTARHRTNHEEPAALPDISVLGKDSRETEAIIWTMEHNHRAGWGTDHFPDCRFQYLCVRTASNRFGVIGVEASKHPLNKFEENILLSLIDECAISMESEKNRAEREEVQILMENERFRSKLLRSISHDLRTPLTSISGNAGNLLRHEENFRPQEKKQIYSDIYEDSIWLIDQVENLLSMTRLEENVELHMSGEVVSDILSAAVSRFKRQDNRHELILDADDEYLIAMMDSALILQVLFNLINNAVKHTPDQSTIWVRDRREGDLVRISVADNGPGIPDQEKPRIFDLFYTGENKAGDSSRSLGLGLNLCKSIIEAHGQSIRVEDNLPTGAVFSFSLKLWEGSQNESVSNPGR